ncbi:MAG: iron ABC transporter substrate-binding protein [Actinobacteria bacterium]|nr:iron ABC transporter substrate-binding protein [Actinomycetota bacterium]
MTANPGRLARALAVATTAALTLGLTACGSEEEPADAADADPANDPGSSVDDGAAAEGDGTLTLYSGRNEELVQPVLDMFTEDTGIEVEVRYAGTSEMAAQLLEEGEASPADVFLAQDAGALGAVAAEGMLADLPPEILELVPETYRSAEGTWVGVTGRARVLVYNQDAVQVEELPESVFELVDPQWSGRVGVAPTNASFQSFVTAMRVIEGDDVAEQWLADLAANDPQVRESNGDILADVTDGVIDVGLINHYYLFELAQEQGVDPEELDSALHFFPGGDVGGLVNIAGVGLVGEQEDGDAQVLVDYLLSTEGQEYFRTQTHEYPLIEEVQAEEGLPALAELEVPDIDLNDLEDLQTTVQMISEAGLS